jgi:hypothetical protein
VAIGCASAVAEKQLWQPTIKALDCELRQSSDRAPIARKSNHAALELDTDRRILRRLPVEGTMRNTSVAHALTRRPDARARSRLGGGVISRYVALVDPERVGLGVR